MKLFKPCKGTSKALGYGCGDEVSVKLRKYGLCRECYKDWFFNAERSTITQKNSTKKCKECKDPFTPFSNNSLQKFCMVKDECIAASVKQLQEDILKESRKQTAVKKEEMKTKSDYEKELEKVFNEFIRLRDKDQPCISCDAEPHTYRITAGHYFPQGSNKNIRFDEDNVHSQCWFNCNKNRHGNLSEYLPRLIAKIGEKRYNELAARRNEERHYSIPELKELKIVYKAKVKELK